MAKRNFWSNLAIWLFSVGPVGRSLMRGGIPCVRWSWAGGRQRSRCPAWWWGYVVVHVLRSFLGPFALAGGTLADHAAAQITKYCE